MKLFVNYQQPQQQQKLVTLSKRFRHHYLGNTELISAESSTSTSTSSVSFGRPAHLARLASQTSLSTNHQTNRFIGSFKQRMNMPCYQQQQAGGESFSTSASNESTKETSPQKYESWEIVSRVAKLIEERLTPEAQANSPLVQFRTPDEMRKDFPEIKLDDKAKNGSSSDSYSASTEKSVNEVLELCKTVVDYSTMTAHPFFLNQLFRGGDVYGMAATMLTEALNTNAHTYEVSPVFHVAEQEVVAKLNQLCGIENGDGGSLANMFGINLARFVLNKDYKKTGMFDSSRLSHYSVSKGASFMGFGTDSIVKIKTDQLGQIIPEEFEKAVQQSKVRGDIPLIMVATSGTTVLSGFDPLDAIGDICQKYKIWLHTDACVGGAFLLSEKHRHLMAGVEKSDSITWNWHKLTGAPLTCTAFLTRHRNLLKEAHSYGADYLFSKRYYDTAFDSGDGSIQCGRKPDSFKVWLMLKARGVNGMGELVDQTVEAAEYLQATLAQNSSRFKLLFDKPNGTTVCFHVIPPSAASLPEGSPEFNERIDQAALELKGRMVQAGRGMVTYQPVKNKDLPCFYRIALTVQPMFTKEHAQDLVRMFVELSDDL